MALLIMAMAKHPEFVAGISELVGTQGLVDPVGMAEAMKSTVTSLGHNEDDCNVVGHVCMAPLTLALTRLGILVPNDAKAGILLAEGRFEVVHGVPSNLQACFHAASSHKFPDVTTAADIPTYLKSWCKFLTMLPAALEVGDNSDGKLTLTIIGKLNMWLKSSFLDASPTMARDAVAMWPIGSRLNKAITRYSSLVTP